jgi:4-amino-4-deoxy-L-arabinose transferase-like glycosyltransferase
MQARTLNTRIAAILFLALLVRLLGIVSRPIWYDEAFSILFAEKGIHVMLSGTLTAIGGNASEEHPLGYYMLLWLWMKFFGQTLASVRLLSVIAGLISVYLVYRIALEGLADEKAAELSMFLAALSPFQIHYSQEIRMYAFLAMWLLLATFAYQRGSKTGDWKWWLGFSISAALAQYTHHLAAFYLIPLALLPIFHRDWKTLRAVALAGLFALVLYTPWLVQLPAQFSKVQNTYWIGRPDISKLFTLLVVYTANTPLPGAWLMPALTIAVVVVTIGIVQSVRPAGRASSTDGVRLLSLAIVPVVLLFLFSQWRPVYVERSLLASGAVFCIWLAWVVTRTGLPRFTQSILLGLLCIAYFMGIYQHLTYHDFPYGPFRELSASLQQRTAPEDVILHSNKLSMLPAVVFERTLSQSFIGDPPGSPTDTLAPATQQALGIRAEKDVRSATEGASRVWYIIYERSIAEYQAAGYTTHPDITYLDSQFALKTEERWNGIQLLIYTQGP